VGIKLHEINSDMKEIRRLKVALKHVQDANMGKVVPRISWGVGGDSTPLVDAAAIAVVRQTYGTAAAFKAAIVAHLRARYVALLAKYAAINPE